MNSLYSKIRKLREEKGLSVEELAEELGLTKRTLASYESGKKQLSIEHLKSLADYYEVSIDGLLNRNNQTVNLNLADASFFTLTI